MTAPAQTTSATERFDINKFHRDYIAKRGGNYPDTIIYNHKRYTKRPQDIAGAPEYWTPRKDFLAGVHAIESVGMNKAEAL